MRKYGVDQFIFHSRSRRRGQALLLSVLIMIFIVLLGTTFIAIVASNMSNTARTGSKDQARQAAKAGIEFADSELTGSDAGLDWRPTYSAPSGTFYYTSFDRAQGWNLPFYISQTGSTAPAYFVKYPNPQGASPSDTSANFMIRVSQVQANELPDNVDNTKTGDIRIESIGFANDDPAAYYKIVAYKSGAANNPLTAAMRSISNWDWNNNAVPQGTVDASGTSTSMSFVLTDSTGTFQKDDYVTVWDPTSNMIGNGIVSGVASGNPTTVSVSAPIGFTPSEGSIVQKAAALGAPANVKFDNATDTPVDYRVSGINNLGGSAINSPGSVWVNGGLIWSGKNFTTNLIAPSAATAANPASYLKVSGVFASSAGAQVQATGTGVSTDTAIPTSSADSTYATNATVINGLVDDGVNRLLGSLSPTRQVQNFTPPDITAGGDGFGRYRQLTQYSTSTDPSNPQASAYGYGQGIYINNPTDVEKVGSTPMTQTQLHDLWFTPGTVPTTNTILATSYERSQVPALPSSTSNSLEEQHVRGWVSPDQFLPRGAEVIINDNNTITVNLDPLDDNSSTYPHANFAFSTPTSNPTKGWRNADGSLAGDATNGGVYSQTFNWPANGTLFAEGNIRIRGVDTNATSSLTVVSMNNIYIDGSLKLTNPSGANPKVLLLAKKNVVVNPTLTLQPVQAVTTLSAATTGSATQNTIDVYDLSNMKVGDYISMAGTNYLITGKSANMGAGTLTLNRYLPATVRTAGTIVQTVFDPRTDIGSYASTYYNRPYTAAIRLSRASNVIQRRVQWPDATANIRLAFRHSAEYRKALEVDIQQPTVFPNAPTINTATLTNKIMQGATSPQDIIKAADKAITVTYDETLVDGVTHNTGTDTFLATQPADQTTAAGKSLNDLVAEMTSKHPTTQWNYNPTTTVVDPNYAAATKQPRYYFLASSGSRYPFAAQYTPQPTPGSSNPYPPASEPSNPIYPQPSSGVLDIPMATSVWTLLNNVQTPLSLIPGLDIVNQFGFSPIFIDAATPQNEAEDVLTTDQYFYQPHATTAPDATYPYYYPGVQNLSGAYASNYAGQIKYDTDAQYTLDSRTLETLPNAGSNEIVLQQNDATVDGTDTVQDYFTNKTQPTDTLHYPMPFYRLSNLKLQNESFDSSTPPNLDQIGAGTTFDINAYVYAQEGGWYVIPGTNFDSAVKNNDDLNRDGVISQGETAAAYRYHRYNYQIVFTGAIMENQTASVSDVGDWTDKWATVKLTNADFSGGSVQASGTAGTQLFYNSADPATNDFNTILYFYDPTAAQGALSTDPGFHAPVAAGLIYQG